MAVVSPVKLAYSTYTSKDNQNNSVSPVIFLHGLTGNKDHWGNVPQSVADQTKRMCYAIDARNHGASEFTETFEFSTNTVDLLHFLDSIHAEKAILVGYSMGGITAIETALTQPNRVEKVIIVDMHVKKLDKGVVDSMVSYMSSCKTAVQQLPKDLPSTEAIPRTLDLLYSNLASDTLISSQEIEIQRIRNTVIRKQDGTYYVKCNLNPIIEAFRNYDTLQTECIGRFDGPALFLIGELSDFCVSKDKSNIKRHFPNAEFVEFKGATHSLVYESPVLFLQTLLRFLQK